MNDTMNMIRELRSVRSFTNQPISQENLDRILEASLRTANASSRQSYSIVVLTDRDRMQEVCGYQGAVTLVYCVDFNRLLDIADYLNQEFEKSMTIDFITGSTDTVLAAQTAVIAAKSLGVDSLVTNGVHRQDFKKLYDRLQLPSKNCFPLLAVVLGYAKNTVNQMKGRVTAGVVHYDTYHRLTREEIKSEIDLFDSKQHNYGLISNTDWQAMGFDHYYEWFFRAWTHKQEDRFYPVLKEAEFLP